MRTIQIRTVMAKEGLGKIYENGELFVKLFLKNQLVTGGSMFKHKYIHKINVDISWWQGTKSNK